MLDRLSDDEPDRTRESRDKRVLSPQRLRESVRRDLSWLLNNTHLATVQDLDAYPYVEQSTLNYGMPDLAGKTASTVDSSALEKSIRRAIWKESVRVKAVVNDKQMNHNALCFTIEAELWAQPLPLRLFLRTDVDLETGSVVVTEAARTD